MQDNELHLKAEVIEVKSKKTASTDVSYRVVLQTNDPKVLSLGALEGDTILDVVIKVDEGL